MARVLGPFHSDKARGSIGPITASSWKGGPVLRRIPIPSKRMRTTQPRNRSMLGFLSREYGTLTDDQRDLWETYALNHPQPDGFGSTFIMSGQNAYVMLNHSGVRLGGIEKLQTTPPTDPPPASLNFLTAETGLVGQGDVDLEWAFNGSGSADDYVEIRQAGPFQSPARQEVHSRFKYIWKIIGTETTYTVKSLVVGTWYWFLVRYIDQYGQKTAWLTSQATPYEGGI